MNIVIGLAENYPAGFDKSKIDDAITNFVIKNLNPNDNLYVFDAQKIKTIAEFKLGDKEEYKNPNVKRRKFAKTLLQLRQYIESLPEVPSSELTHSLVNIPRFLEHLSTNKLDILKSDNKKVSILLIGNALFQDKKEVGFNMQEGWFPADGHIKTDLKGSLFGTKDRQTYLKGVSFNHLVTNKDDEWQTDLYQQRIRRFWNLYIQAQGGKYTTFTADIDTAFERFAMPDLDPVESFEFDHTANKVEMLRANRVVVQGNGGSEADDFMNDNVTISTQPPSKTKGIIKIGIRWYCQDCDIDLYAKTNPAPEFLFYSNNQTNEGRYIKDFTSSPETLNGLEQVEFTREVEVTDLNVLINFYGGRSDKAD